MDNNENNNVNLQPNIGGEILLGDTPETNTNQGLNQTVQNNLNTNQTINPQPVNNENVDNIFSQTTQEPVQQQPSVSLETPIQNNNLESNDVLNTQPTSMYETSIPTEVPKQKKSKGPIIIIILLLLVVLGLAGYIVYDKFFTKEEPKVEEKVKEEKKVLLKDENQDVVYSDIDEKHEGKIKKVPYINIDSKYAEEINDEIDSMVKKGLDGQVADTAYGVDYQYYINGEIVSVKFTWETENGMTISKIYNINQYTGKKVTNSELLTFAAMEESGFNDKLVESYKTARPLESVENNAEALVKECYQKDLDTLSKGDIKGMYLNNNEIYVLFDLNYIAGAGKGEVILNVSSNKLIMNPFTLE